ncbi:MAG: trigger factor [Acidobacteria bacterium]|nr:trigger factor [Acidobacteriota bacterium]
MADSCLRTMEIEVPADVVQKKVQKIALDYQRHARLPGFRQGKAPLSLIQRRYEEDIRGQALQDLVPEYVEAQVREKKWNPVGTPSVTNVEFSADAPLRFKASVEVMPEITLGDYAGLHIHAEKTTVSDEEIADTLKRMQAEGASYVNVEEPRPVQDGDFASLAVVGSDPSTAADPDKPAVTLDDVLCEIGGQDTVQEFSDHLRGANAGDMRTFDVAYAADFRDSRLAGKTLSYQVKVLGIKKKQVPDLDDEFAKEMGPFESLEALRTRIREDLGLHKQHEADEDARRRLRKSLNELHDFPVPETLVEKQTDRRMDRLRRQLASQGMEQQFGSVDWPKVRTAQREEAEQEIKTSLILEQIADKENLEVTQAEVDAEIEKLATSTGTQAAQVRARLSSPEAIDRIKDQLRIGKALDFVLQAASK